MSNAMYLDSMARCGGKMAVVLYANSICQRGAQDARYGFHIRYGSAPFCAATEVMRDAINALPPATEWLYYPDRLGKSLAAAGISSTIYAHSGKVYEDGVAQQ